VIVNVLVPDAPRVMVAGLNVAESPEDAIVEVKAISPVKPYVLDAVIVDVPEEPA
jgi:hypothetical protein